MKRIRPHVKYQGISFEITFIAEIKKHIMFNPMYRSIADFAREAIREKIRRDQLEGIEELKEGIVFARELKEKRRVNKNG